MNKIIIKAIDEKNSKKQNYLCFWDIIFFLNLDFWKVYSTKKYNYVAKINDAAILKKSNKKLI